MEYVDKLFKDEHIAFISNKLDEVTFRKGVLDLVDQPIYKLSLGLINKAVSPKIPDEYKPEFWEVMDQICKEDFDDAAAEAVDVIVIVVNKWEVKPSVKELVLGVLSIAKATLAGLD